MVDTMPQATDPGMSSYSDHTCSFYENRTQQFASLVSFFREGLLRHNKCVYVIDAGSPTDVTDVFGAQGFDLGPYLSSRQMVILTKNDTYLLGGHFEQERMLHMIEDLERAAIGDGYGGLYGAAEMTWALDQPSIANNLIAYESLLNVTLPGSRTKVLCMYDETRFLERTLTDIVRTHPHVMIHGDAVRENSYFFTPPQYMRLSDRFSASAYKEMLRELCGEL